MTQPQSRVAANVPRYVSFSAEINTTSVESLIAAMSDFANQGAEDVTLLLSTPGGEVLAGINLYNVLRGFPFTLTTHNVGSVNSIGNPIFLAGDKRYATANATFMFHGVGVNVNQGSRLEEKRINELLQSVQTDNQRIAGIIADRTQIPEPEIERFFLQQETKDAAYAVGVGIIDEIRDVEIPKGSPIHSLVFQR